MFFVSLSFMFSSLRPALSIDRVFLSMNIWGTYLKKGYSSTPSRYRKHWWMKWCLTLLIHQCQQIAVGSPVKAAVTLIIQYCLCPPKNTTTHDAATRYWARINLCYVSFPFICCSIILLSCVILLHLLSFLVTAMDKSTYIVVSGFLDCSSIIVCGVFPLYGTQYAAAFVGC